MPTTLSQFAKGSLPEELRPNAIETLALINEVTKKIQSLRFSSGYRNAAHNKKVGGVVNSQHVQAAAADFVTKNHQYSPAVLELFNSIAAPRGYNAFVHDAGSGLHIHSERRGKSPFSNLTTPQKIGVSGVLMLGGLALAAILIYNK